MDGQIRAVAQGDVLDLLGRVRRKCPNAVILSFGFFAPLSLKSSTSKVRDAFKYETDDDIGWFLDGVFGCQDVNAAHPRGPDPCGVDARPVAVLEQANRRRGRGSNAVFTRDLGPRALTSPSGGLLRALAEVAAVFVLQLVLFQLAEEIGFTGFLQHHWRDRYHPMKLTLYVALLRAAWHMPDHFAEEA